MTSRMEDIAVGDQKPGIAELAGKECFFVLRCLFYLFN